ncbi:D-serine deaminase [Pseudomonas syringae pv. actinidiae]|uniref:D-serine deaminase n=1 Tax=Pseudomonas syringae pv. actinidiae TaxID=103796 RepID=A0A2V0QI41_PSESF|nr:D-serine deaminase [Pseudomonas syringae pv. actinidiae]
MPLQKSPVLRPGLLIIHSLSAQALRNKHGQRLTGHLHPTNMIWEFGDFLDDSLKPAKKKRQPAAASYHQSPNF